MVPLYCANTGVFAIPGFANAGGHKTFEFGTEFLTCTRFCFQKSKLFGKILDQKLTETGQKRHTQETIILSSVNSPLVPFKL